MNNFNYCFDKCEFNKCKRHYWNAIEDGKLVSHSKSDESNKELKCALGYLQSVNNRKALLNSLKNGTEICLPPRKIFDSRQAKTVNQ